MLIDLVDRIRRGLPCRPQLVAGVIERFALDALHREDSPSELHDLAAKVLNRPLLTHGCFDDDELL